MSCKVDDDDDDHGSCKDAIAVEDSSTRSTKSFRGPSSIPPCVSTVFVEATCICETTYLHSCSVVYASSRIV